MTGKIFVSYRREDEPGYALALYHGLRDYFDADQIFMDVDTLEPGQDFVTVIEEAVSQCDVFIAIIGKRWSSCADEAGRRLDNPYDWVRVEIRSALKRGIRLIPVLAEEASMPKPDELPNDMVDLARRHAFHLRHARFSRDMADLVELLTKRSGLSVNKPAPDRQRKIEAEPVAAAVNLGPSDGDIAPARVRGIWKNPYDGTTICVSDIGGHPALVYSYRWDRTLDARSVDVVVRGQTLYVRLEWLGNQVYGALMLHMQSDHALTGGYWKEENLPEAIRPDLTKLNESVSGMKRMFFERDVRFKDEADFPSWAKKYFERERRKWTHGRASNEIKG